MFCVGQRINSLIFVIWPVIHKNYLGPFFTKTKPRSLDIKISSLFLANDYQRPVVIKILSIHFWLSDEIQESDSFNVFLRPRIPNKKASFLFKRQCFHTNFLTFSLKKIICNKGKIFLNSCLFWQITFERWIKTFAWNLAKFTACNFFFIKCWNIVY